ncbi:MAG: HNH endonuclease [Planctomycetaceae bacterium]
MSKCQCGRHYTDQWHRWRVLNRSVSPKRSSKLYCLDCRAEWSSRAKYIVLLADHEKRVRSGLTDADVLAMIEAGRLVVDVNRATVVGPAGTPLVIVTREHKDGPARGTYRFVKICAQGRQKKVALHRLVWMAAHRSLVPDGFDVDHVRSQDDDRIGNLRLLESSENRSLGQAKACRNTAAIDEDAEAPF